MCWRTTWFGKWVVRRRCYKECVRDRSVLQQPSRRCARDYSNVCSGVWKSVCVWAECCWSGWAKSGSGSGQVEWSRAWSSVGTRRTRGCGGRVRKRGLACSVERRGVGRQRGTPEQEGGPVESVAEGDGRPVWCLSRRCAPGREASNGFRSEDARAEEQGQLMQIK